MPSMQADREEMGENRRPIYPTIGDFFDVVPEKTKIERIAAGRLELHDLAHGLDAGRLSIGGQTHNLVLIAIMGKAEILRHRLIKNTERVRKENLAVHG